MQLLRVGGRWNVDRYGADLDSADTERATERNRYLEAQRSALRERSSLVPGLYMLVSLSEPELDVASYVSRLASRPPSEIWGRLRRFASPVDRRMLTAKELESVRVRADRVQARLADFVSVRPARGVEIQWLVRRVFSRGLGEPVVDGLHEPRALAFERNGEAVLAPLEGDVLRWLNCEVEQRSPTLRVESELGTSWQAQLALGAVPERLDFPGARAELLFAPPESLGFEIDVAVTARFLPNEVALRLAPPKIQDADQILRAEAVGEQGVSDLGYERTQDPRDLLVLPPGVESSSTTPRDDRARGRGCRRGAAGEPHRVRAARLWRGATAPPARRAARSCSSSTCRASAPASPASTTYFLGRATGGDDADRHTPRRSRSRLLSGPHTDRLAAPGAVQPSRRLRAGSQCHDSQRWRARVG